MTWIIWSLEGEYGFFKWSRDSWKLTDALVRNGAEVWEIELEKNRDCEAITTNTLNLEALEKKAILEALDLSNWSQKKASSFLGVTPRSLNYKIVQHEIVNHFQPDDGRSIWTKNKPSGKPNGKIKELKT